jgi:hypothetical protein
LTFLTHIILNRINLILSLVDELRQGVSHANEEGQTIICLLPYQLPQWLTQIQLAIAFSLLSPELIWTLFKIGTKSTISGTARNEKRN